MLDVITTLISVVKSHNTYPLLDGYVWDNDYGIGNISSSV